MYKFSLAGTAVVATLLVFAPRAEAQNVLSEIKLGALAHDVGPLTDKREEGVDTNLELLFTSPDFLKPIWAPRPHVGGSLNSSGDTSHVYAGLTWTFDFLEKGFFDVSVGGGLHNGEERTQNPDKKALGCHLLFRESLGFGYRFTERHSIMAYWDHLSNASLCSPNEGLESVGIRYGYRF